MLTIEPSGKVLGATVRGADLRQDLSREDFGAVLRALGEHGVLCFPGQALEAAELGASRCASAISRSSKAFRTMSPACPR